MLRKLPRISSTRIVLLTTAVIVGYFLVTGATTALRSNDLSERENQLRAEIGEVEERYQRLEALRGYLNSDEYIEAVAREQLGLVRKGESSIVVIPSAPASGSEPETAAEGELWWETLIR